MKTENPEKLYKKIALLTGLAGSLWGTTLMLYLVKNAGLDPLQLTLLGAALEGSVLIFEVPTGLLADMKSRRLSIIVGYAVMGAGFAIMAVPCFPVILAGFVLYAIGYTFTSGAEEAWLSNELDNAEKTSAVFVEAEISSRTGVLVGTPAGLVLGYLHLGVPLIAGGALYAFLVVYLVLGMHESSFSPRAEGALLSLRRVAAGIRNSLRREWMLALLFLLAFLFGLHREGMDWLTIPHLTEDYVLPLFLQGNRIVLLRLIGLAGHAVTIRLLRLVKRYLSRPGKEGMIITAAYTVRAAVILLFASAPGFASAVLFSLLIDIVTGLADPVRKSWFSRLSGDTESKATLFSFNGQLDSIGQLIGGPIAGYAGRESGIPQGIRVSALLLVPVIITACTAYILARRKSSEKDPDR